jgi:hypothetical protein
MSAYTTSCGHSLHWLFVSDPARAPRAATAPEYKSADRLIAAAEVRRDRTLREIERRREHLARRVREASDKIIDDEAAEVARAAA